MNDKRSNYLWLNLLGMAIWLLILFLCFELILPWQESSARAVAVLATGGLSTLWGLILLGLEHEEVFARLWSSTVSKIIFALVTYLIGAISLVYSNQFIADVTGVDPARFESGKHLLSLLIAPLFWSLAFYFTLLVVYFCYLVPLLKTAIKPKDGGQQIMRQSAIFASLLLWLSIVGPGLLRLYATKDVEHLLTKVFVFSSYLDNKSLCTQEPKTVSVAFLESNVISVAEKSNDGNWRFRLSTCHPELKGAASQTPAK